MVVSSFLNKAINSSIIHPLLLFGWWQLLLCIYVHLALLLLLTYLYLFVPSRTIEQKERASTVCCHHLHLSPVFLVSCSSPLHHVILGCPLLLCTCEFYSKSCLITSSSHFLKTWTIHLHFLSLIFTLTSVSLLLSMLIVLVLFLFLYCYVLLSDEVIFYTSLVSWKFNWA